MVGSRRGVKIVSADPFGFGSRPELGSSRTDGVGVNKSTGSSQVGNSSMGSQQQQLLQQRRGQEHGGGEDVDDDEEEYSQLDEMDTYY
jgi:hypothetical protein